MRKVLLALAFVAVYGASIAMTQSAAVAVQDNKVGIEKVEQDKDKKAKKSCCKTAEADKKCCKGDATKSAEKSDCKKTCDKKK